MQHPPPPCGKRAKRPSTNTSVATPAFLVRQWLQWLALLLCAVLSAPTLAQTVLSLPAAQAPSADLRQALTVLPGGALRLDRLLLDDQSGEQTSADLRRTNQGAKAPLLVVHSGSEITQTRPAPRAHFTGQLVGDPQSSVFVSIDNEGAMRSIVRRGGEFFVSEMPAPGAVGTTYLQTPTLQARRVNHLTDAPETPFTCGVDDQFIQDNYVAPSDALLENLRNNQKRSGLLGVASQGTAALGAQRRADIIIETDYELLQRLGGSPASVYAYVTDLMGYISSQYESEVGTRLNVTQINVYSSPADPWAGDSDFTLLNELINHWNTPSRFSQPRHHVHLLSARPIGGRAPINTLGNKKSAYGVSGGISGQFSASNPRVVWDAKVIAHEIGHAFGSSHTHSFDNPYLGSSEGGAIDCCYSEPSGAQCINLLGGTGRSGQLPGINSITGGSAGTGAGTIMSYCHLLAGYGNNISFNFGTNHTRGVNPWRVASVLQSSAQTHLPMDTLETNYALIVSRQGTGSGIVTIAPGGMECDSTCTASYAYGTQLTLSAQAASGSSFAGWGGACSGTSSSCTVTMSAARDVTASFNATASNRIVTLNKAGSGTGSVSSTLSGLNCGEGCAAASASVASTSAITLTAQATSGSTFDGWGGACSGTSSSCAIPAGASNANITAQFNSRAVRNHALLVSREGTGSGAIVSMPNGINCGNTCTASYAANTQVVLSVQAAMDSTFSGWSGSCSGTGTCTVTMDSIKSVTASFALKSAVTGLKNRLAAGSYYSAVLRDAGSLWAWGSNSSGQVGDGSITRRTRPVQVGIGYTAVAAGGYHTLALDTDGNLWAWGENNHGQLGDGSTTNHTTPVYVGTGYTAVAAGYFHSLALKADGSLWAWGYNGYGQLGDGSTVTRTNPVQVGAGYTAVTATHYHTLALKVDGSLWAWGANGDGQLGDGSTTHRTSPFQVGTGYTAMATGRYHTLALKADSSLWAWGGNGLGQLGDGSITHHRFTPVQIGTGYVAIAVGNLHSLALKADSSLWAWGVNSQGQLGDGSTIDRKRPVQVGAGYTAVAAGYFHSLALKNDGNLWAWGYNSDGQLGDGSAASIRSTPGLVSFGSTVSVPLSILKAGSGSGMVTSNPAGINCGSTCTSSYAARTQVTLIAQADAGSSFSGWSGVCFGTGSCTVSMDSARSVTANFTTNGGSGGPLPDPVAFVTQQYLDFLRRAPDSVSLTNWVNQLNAGTISRDQLIYTLMNSGESQGRFGPIMRLYSAYFLRLPDYDGLMYWFNTMYPSVGAGAGLAQVSNAFASSAEFVSRYGALNNEAFVTLVYQNVLGRDPEPDGFQYWVAQLRGGLSRGQMMIGFSESAENQSITANGQRITLVYVAMLGRAPTASEHAQWLAEVNAGRASLVSLIAAVLNSAEYAARF